MAGDWIKMRHDLADDPAVLALSQRTGASLEQVVGCLHKLWSWADRHTTNGHAPVTPVSWIDAFVHVDGFANVLLDIGWLVCNERDTEGDMSGFSIPKFGVHNSESAKKRAVEAKRKRKQRSRSCPAGVPSATGPEKRREEKRRKKKEQEKGSFSIADMDLERKTPGSNSLSAGLDLERKKP